MSVYQLALLLGVVWIWGTLAGVLLAVAGRRFANPEVGRHREQR